MFKKYFLFLCILAICLSPSTAQAVTGGLVVAPILPENQIEDSSYFNLEVRPGKKQSLQIQLENLDEQIKTVRITPTTAFTNKNGQLDYSISKIIPLQGPNFREIVSEAQHVTLQPHEKRVVTFLLNVPKNSFSGLVLGGFHILDESKKTTNGIQQELNYVVGVMLREDMKLPKPKLNLSKVTSIDNQLAIKLENPTGALISQYQLTGTLESSNRSVKISPQTISAAPQAAFTLLLNTEENLTSGNYQFNLSIKGPEKFQFHPKISVGHTTKELSVKEIAEWKYEGIILAAILLLLSIILARRKKHV